MKYILCLIGFVCVLQVQAQEFMFSSEVSTDHVKMDEVFELTFTMENTSGEFIGPALEEFIIVGGPNVSSSIQIINGDMSQKKKYTYYLKAKYEGVLLIESAFIESDEGGVSSPEITIVVGESNLNDQIEQPLKRESTIRKEKKDLRNIFKGSKLKKI